MSFKQHRFEKKLQKKLERQGVALGQASSGDSRAKIPGTRFKVGETIIVLAVTALKGTRMVIIQRESDGVRMHLPVSEVIAILHESGDRGTITEVLAPAYYQVKLGRSDFMTGVKEEEIRKCEKPSTAY